MSIIGKAIRMERFIKRENGRTIIIPMDHGVGAGPIKGLTNLPEAVDKVALGGANAVLGHMGLAKYGHRKYGNDVGLIIHLSASTSLGPNSNHKVLVTTVEEAIKVGADAVSIHVNVGAEDEPEMLEGFGKIASKCDEWGMPLLAMMYPRGPKITSEFSENVVAHAARLGAELGADIVKTNYTGDIDSFRTVVRGCPVPIIIAGGPHMDSEMSLLKMVADSLEAGGAGVAIGRNVFQSENPTRIVKRIHAIVHGGLTPEEAFKIE
ncbi:2-amino-3,7-dideoxy-D-threo-hept-6-ulosonate synthase [Methanolapillus ohkumae]|uniref:2-amino-3,7-dideoxy-D-threo-hept-6-ulosonate synthase n=1 Tax=Methanolapillus ohkumae TaxID=3028298 RepID=A0AA96ZV09_9EURY|nr:2-amino-4,5-dihydroxy-6-oxo-7-(phosphonooxy)heptanoate synthase [Methanosarcinaceae archaeon Am2]